MYNINKLIPQSQFQQLLKLLLKPKQLKRRRKRVEKKALLNGILQVLVNGVAWEKIAECGCSYSSCWRYFHKLQQRGKLKLIYLTLAGNITDLQTSAIDTHWFALLNLLG